MKKLSKLKFLSGLLLTVALLMPACLMAQDGDQAIKLTLVDQDSVKTCKAVVMVNDIKPVKGVQVNFYVKRFFGLLPLATLESTDENGEASVAFPSGLPGDSLGNVTVIARLEDDDAVMDQQTVCWGTKLKNGANSSTKALWASRSNAPTYLIIASNTIIIGIWGTMGYILFLLFFRIKKSGIDFNP